MQTPIEQHSQCPAAGCTNDRDPVFGLCRRCRGVVSRRLISDIAEAHRSIEYAGDTLSKSRAVLAWNKAIEKATAFADAWGRDHASR